MKNLQDKYIGKKIDHMNILNIEDAAKIANGKKNDNCNWRYWSRR